MKNTMCFARGHQGSWEALCLDFDIAVQGVSFEDVHRDLVDAIGEYVAAAREEDDVTREKLLNRRVPWHVRLQWILQFVWYGIRPLGNADAQAAFPVACAA